MKTRLSTTIYRMGVNKIRPVNVRTKRINVLRFAFTSEEVMPAGAINPTQDDIGTRAGADGLRTYERGNAQLLGGRLLTVVITDICVVIAYICVIVTDICVVIA